MDTIEVFYRPFELGNHPFVLSLNQIHNIKTFNLKFK